MYNAENLAKLFFEYSEQNSKIPEFQIKWCELSNTKKKVLTKTAQDVLDHLDRECNFQDGDELECVYSLDDWILVGQKCKLEIRKSDNLNDISYNLLMDEEHKCSLFFKKDLAFHFRKINNE